MFLLVMRALASVVFRLGEFLAAPQACIGDNWLYWEDPLSSPGDVCREQIHAAFR